MLKIILLRKKKSDKQTELKKLRERLSGLKKREEEIAQAIEEAETEEEKAAVEEAVAEIETANTEAQEAIAAVSAELDKIEEELAAAEEAAAAAVEEDGEDNTEEERSRRSAVRKRGNHMELREAQNFQRTGRHSYKNVRSVLAPATSNSKTVGPTGVGGINDPVAAVSALCDLVKITDCTGMAAYKVAFLKNDPTAGNRTDGAALSPSDPTFGSVTMTPAIKGTLGYISKEIRKQSPLDYEEKVQESARRALRRAVNSVIVNATLASSQADAFELVPHPGYATGEALFTPSLLTDIILAYGGDEGVDGAAVLCLNKVDLKAFAAVRGENEFLPVYSITPDADSPSTGVIKDNNGLSCRYLLCNDLTPLYTQTLSETATKHMIFASPQCIELALWGGYDVEVNDGYKFGEGLLTVAGEVSCAAEVTVAHGAVVVTAKHG